MNKKTKFLMVFLVFLLCVSFTSCSQKIILSDSEGNLLKYKEDEVLNDENRENFYILNTDATFTPLMSDVLDFEGIAEQSSPTRFITWSNRLLDDKHTKDELIPVVTKNDDIVCVYKNTKDMPVNLVLEKYKDYGYTIGSHIGVSEDGESAEIYSDCYDNTDLNDNLEVMEDEKNIIESINENKVPISNIDPNMDFLLGLEKEKKYKLTYFVGTKYKETETIADLHVMQSEKIIKLNNPYTKTKYGFFKINLPENLESGFYFLEDSGLFYYKAK